MEGTDISLTHPIPKPCEWGFPGNWHTGQIMYVIIVWGRGFGGGPVTFCHFQQLSVCWIPPDSKMGAPEGITELGVGGVSKAS